MQVITWSPNLYEAIKAAKKKIGQKRDYLDPRMECSFKCFCNG